MARVRQTAPVSGPMGPKQLDELNRLIKSCEETAAYCGKCSRAGLDVTPEERKNADQLEVARKLKREFFPDAK